VWCDGGTGDITHTNTLTQTYYLQVSYQKEEPKLKVKPMKPAPAQPNDYKVRRISIGCSQFCLCKEHSYPYKRDTYSFKTNTHPHSLHPQPPLSMPPQSVRDEKDSMRKISDQSQPAKPTPAQPKPFAQVSMDRQVRQDLRGSCSSESECLLAYCMYASHNKTHAKGIRTHSSTHAHPHLFAFVSPPKHHALSRYAMKRTLSERHSSSGLTTRTRMVRQS